VRRVVPPSRCIPGPGFLIRPLLLGCCAPGGNNNGETTHVSRSICDFGDRQAEGAPPQMGRRASLALITPGYLSRAN